jgi:hypothetical protein
VAAGCVDAVEDVDAVDVGRMPLPYNIDDTCQRGVMGGDGLVEDDGLSLMVAAVERDGGS